MSSERFYEAPTGASAGRSAPAVMRNREPIAEVLGDWLPAGGLVLEVASGTGEHALFFAERFPGLDWQPTDMHPDALASIRAWREGSRLTNLREPLVLDAARPETWPVAEVHAVLSINMVHISPWSAALGLIAGSAKRLSAGSPLILYGPWLERGVEPAPSNLAFDADLKRRDARWGLREVEDFADAAAQQGFSLAGRRQMPANNLMLLFRKGA